MIDLEFYEPEKRWFKQNEAFRRVRSAWHAYMAHLDTAYPRDKATEAVYLNDRNTLFVDLLATMAIALRYDEFDKSELQKRSYMPNWHADIEAEQTVIRKGLADVLKGNIAIPMKVVQFPFVVEPPTLPADHIPPPADIREIPPPG